MCTMYSVFCNFVDKRRVVAFFDGRLITGRPCGAQDKAITFFFSFLMVWWVATWSLRCYTLNTMNCGHNGLLARRQWRVINSHGGSQGLLHIVPRTCPHSPVPLVALLRIIMVHFPGCDTSEINR